MPLLSLVRSPLRRRALALAFVLGCGSCFGQPVFLTVRATPYDRQMARVGPALTTQSAPQPGLHSLTDLSQWMIELRAMPYQYSAYWQTPAEVDVAHVSDCKGKAVALYEKMRKGGATNLRLIIGKRHIYDSATHAWLEWETTTGTFVLDPTFNQTPIPTAELDSMIYIPLYAYDGSRKYSVAKAGLTNAPIRVAAGAYQTRVPAIKSLPSPAAQFDPGPATSRPSVAHVVSRNMSPTGPRPMSSQASLTTPARQYPSQRSTVTPAQAHCGFRRLNL